MQRAALIENTCCVIADPETQFINDVNSTKQINATGLFKKIILLCFSHYLAPGSHFSPPSPLLPERGVQGVPCEDDWGTEPSVALVLLTSSVGFSVTFPPHLPRCYRDDSIVDAGGVWGSHMTKLRGSCWLCTQQSQLFREQYVVPGIKSGHYVKAFSTVLSAVPDRRDLMRRMRSSLSNTRQIIKQYFTILNQLSLWRCLWSANNQ